MITTTRSPSKHSLWDPVLANRQQWLHEIPLGLDRVQTDEDQWREAGGEALLAAAIGACIHPGIGVAGATKLLHLKRPRLVPILDQLVAEMMGVTLPASPAVGHHLAVAQRLVFAGKGAAGSPIPPLASSARSGPLPYAYDVTAPSPTRAHESNQ